jgi:18S rRNA (guanine1575-N7)-methyltransferase
MICNAAIRAGFGAGVLEDAAGTKNEKLYLVLTVGEAQDITGVVAGVDNVEVEDRRRGKDKGGKKGKKGKGEVVKGSREWIMKKKERMARQGKVVKMSSKFTGRNRGPKF